MRTSQNGCLTHDIVYTALHSPGPRLIRDNCISLLVTNLDTWDTGDVWRHFWLSLLQRGVILLACSGQRPQMILNRLQCIGKTHRTKNYSSSNISSAKTNTLIYQLPEGRRLDSMENINTSFLRIYVTKSCLVSLLHNVLHYEALTTKT